MTQAKTILVAAPLFAVATACGGSISSPPSVTCTDGHMIAEEANDYTFTSKITMDPVTVKSMTNLTFDWSGLTTDFQGHAVNAAMPLDTAVTMIWNLPLAELESALNADMLDTGLLVVSPPASLTLTGQTMANLYDFTVNGTMIAPTMFDMYFDPVMYPTASTTYLVAVQTGAELGRGIRMLQTFHLDAASTVTSVSLTNTSTKLQYTANLHSLHPTGVPAGTAALTLDWGPPTGSPLMTNGLGAPFVPTQITRAIVGHYTQSPAELEKGFLDLEMIATNLYRANIDSGTTLNFTTLRDENGGAFNGIDDTGTWLVGLFCGNCRNPAPWYMTILKPCTAM